MNIKSVSTSPLKIEICSKIIKFILTIIGLSLMGWLIGAFMTNSFDTSTWLFEGKLWIVGLVIMLTIIIVGLSDDCIQIGD